MSIIVAPARIIKDYLDEYQIDIETFKSLSKLSNKQWLLFYDGELSINENILSSLEILIPSIPRSYWRNLDEKYQELIENERVLYNVDEKNLNVIAKKFKFDEVFKDLAYSRMKQAIEMLKILKILSFDEFFAKYSNLPFEFMEDGGELESIAVWLKLCEEEIDVQNEDISNTEFDIDRLQENLPRFKKLALMKDERGFKVNCRKLCNKLGINLVVNGALTNSKVRGALTTVEGKPTIYISGRFKTHDHIWFAFIHEIGHLVLHYEVDKPIITLEENENVKEEEASQFARDFFINKEAYNTFIESDDYSLKSRVIAFANSQKVQPGIVVGRLQHDGYIPMNHMNDLKIRIDLNS